MEQAELGRFAIQTVAGTHAFRKYDWLTNSVGLNKAGNFRGMVVSARWRTAFQHIGETGEFMENIGFLAGLAAGIAEAGPRISKIADSNDTKELKTMQIAAIAGTISQRVLLGVVPGGTHLIYRSLEGWCQIAGLAGGRAQTFSSECVSTLQHADSLVRTTFNTVTDTSNQSKAFWSIINVCTRIPRAKN